MSVIKNSADEFVIAMNNSKEKLENIQITISGRNTEIESVISAMKNKISKYIENIEVTKKGSKEVKKVLDNSIRKLSEFIDVSENEIKEANKGIKFINDFEKTFIVSIFGKVKAGKSYLGNFIMGNSYKKYRQDTEFNKINDVTVTVYDRGKQTQQNFLNILDEEGEGFKVGSTETTSTIQWFSIGGLSWFDTPGIGSVTLDNENLAKEYIKNSDLVIFVCNSDAAGTRQEFEEMKELADMNKPVLLLITMSDTYEEDVDDDENLIQVLHPKSKKDRDDVEKYMLETIKENNLQKVLDLSEILTISAKLADEAVKKNDDKLYEESNLDKLFKKLIDITCNKAAKMKLTTPKDRLNKMITNIIGNDKTFNSLSFLKQNINELCTGFISGKKDNEKLKLDITEKIRNTCRVEIMRLVSKMKNEMKNGRRSIYAEEIKEKVINIFIAVVGNVCSEELTKIVGDFNKETVNRLKTVNMDISNMEIKTDSISYTQQVVERVRRDPKGFLEHVRSFFGKEYYRNKTRTIEKHSEFDIGDNSSQITAEILQNLDSIINDEVNNFVTEIINGYFKPIEIIRDNVVKEIDNTIKKLKELKL